MNDEQLNQLLEQRAERGTPQGAAAVWAAANEQVDQERAARHRTGPPTGRNRLLFVAAVLLVAVAGVGAVSVLSDGGDGIAETDPAALDGLDEADSLRADPAPAETKPEPETENNNGGGEDATAQNQVGDAQTTTEPPHGADEQGAREPFNVAPIAETDLGAFGSVAAAENTAVAGGWVATVDPGTLPSATGGALRRTVEPVRAVDGRLVIEVDYAASIETRANTAWGEIVVTAAERPTDPTRGGLYAAQHFTGSPVFGCRLHADGQPFCNLYDNTGQTIWQMSTFEQAGIENRGPINTSVWRTCSADDVPEACTERFRIELTKTSVSIVVNDEVYVQQTDVPEIPGELLETEVHIHVASSLSRHDGPERFHWGPLFVGR